jgi:hypothetical protein
MKRLSLFSAALLLAGSSAALAASPSVQWVARQAEPAPMNDVTGEATPDAAPTTSETAPAAPVPMAAPVYGALMAPPGSAGGCGCGAGLTNCCERQYSPLDGVWDNYCAERSHCHPASKVFALLHVESNCHGTCAAPTAPCHTADCFGLPKLHAPKWLTAAPACDNPCEAASCNTCGSARSLFGTYRQKACAKCCAPKSCPGTESAEFGPESAPPPPGEPPPAGADQPMDGGDDGVAPSPPQPELPLPAQPQSEARGWLPLPRLMRLPR